MRGHINNHHTNKYVKASLAILLSLLMVLLPLLCIVPTNAAYAKNITQADNSTQTENATNNDVSAKATDASIFASGTGTEADPYMIETLEQLQAFRDSVNSGTTYKGEYISLGADIDLGSSNWTPIGQGTRTSSTYSTTTTPFQGIFNGNSHIVSNMNIDQTQSGDYALGFFGVLDGATVNDLVLKDVKIDAPTSQCAGGVAGLAVNNSTISGCHVSGSITAASGVGGILGRMIIEGTVSNCSNTANVSGTTGTGNVAGIVGAAYYTRLNKKMVIDHCTNLGAIDGSNAVGGISGLCAAFVSNCINTGNVTGNGFSIGGIAGEMHNLGAISDSTNSGTVTNNSSEYGTGGIAGWIRYNGTATAYTWSAPIDIVNNTNTADIKGGNDAGGIVGVLYSTGNVEGNTNNASSISGKNFAGGIVGNFQNPSGLPTGMTAGASIVNNVSTTPLSDISAVYKGQFVYDNTQNAEGTSNVLTLKDNGIGWIKNADGTKTATTNPDLVSPDDPDQPIKPGNNGGSTDIPDNPDDSTGSAGSDEPTVPDKPVNSDQNASNNTNKPIDDTQAQSSTTGSDIPLTGDDSLTLIAGLLGLIGASALYLGIAIIRRSRKA